MKQVLNAGGCLIIGAAIVIGLILTLTGSAEVQVIPPDADVAASAAALSGMWQTGSSPLIDRVVVERIRPTWPVF